jgi:ParB family chromosome partitioning protein
MRHDFHFVEQLLSSKTQPIGRLLDLLLIDPSPGQPRKQFGDLSDLVGSIRERGVLEPILVRPSGSRYQIIAGERRYRAALEAGVTRVPCMVLDVDDRAVLEISLIENLQRKDLSPFEEADAIARLVESLDLTHEEAARKLGRSRTSLTETLTLVHVPISVRERIQRNSSLGRSTLLQIARLDDEEAMHRLLDQVEQGNLRRDDVRKLTRQRSMGPTARKPGRPRGYTFKFQPPDKTFQLQIKFGRTSVEKEDLIQTLQRIIDSLRSS